MDINKVILVGRLTKDIELKSTQSGTSYVQFDLAVGNGKDKEGNERPTDFINCVAWEKKAENLSVYVHKGHRVAIEGRLQVDKYQNEKRENRYKTYVLVEGQEFLESKLKESFEPNEPDYAKAGPITGEQVDAIPTENDPFATFGDSIEVNDNDLPF